MKSGLSFTGGIITALLATVCCIGPALFILFGITGLGFLTRFESLRPYFLVATFLFIGIAYHYAYGKGPACGPWGVCQSIRAKKVNRALFWILIGFALIGLSLPYVTSWLIT